NLISSAPGPLPTPTDGAGIPAQVRPPSMVRRTAVQDAAEQLVRPSTYPSWSDTKVTDCAWKPAGTGPPGGPAGAVVVVLEAVVVEEETAAAVLVVVVEWPDATCEEEQAARTRTKTVREANAPGSGGCRRLAMARP
ncbi:MAG: hypothetical protein ACYCS2_09515, partial [Acidimicrobiales bacterium]